MWAVGVKNNRNFIFRYLIVSLLILGENLYIGRSHHAGDIIPGKVVQSHGVCYVAYGGDEHGKSNYQVLVHDADSGTDFVWSEAGKIEIKLYKII